MRRKFRVVVNGKVYVVEVEEITATQSSGVESQKFEEKRETYKAQGNKKIERVENEKVEGAIVAPMPGKVTEIRVSPGDEVKKGEVLLILEAMKMENEIVSPRDGVVKEIKVDVGKTVDRGAVLMILG